MAIGVHGGTTGAESIAVEGLYFGPTPGPTGLAGNFYGPVRVTGGFVAGAGLSKIDHPLDPTNKYLNHSFVESPDMMNVYNGVVRLDQNGEAVVTLAEWFETLNKDFRYQLTAMGAPGPNLYIAEEVAGNRFRIAGGTANMKVSWQVTGIRQDALANAHRVPVEEDKPAVERGYYLNPVAFGHPQEKGIAWVYRRDRILSLKELRPRDIAGADRPSTKE